MPKRLIALFLLATATPAVATRFTMQLNPQPQQSARMQNGIASVDDYGRLSSVRLIQVEDDLKKRGSIELIVVNRGNRSFNFGSENVTAMLSDGTPVAIITYEQLKREEKRRETWRGVFAALATMDSGQYSDDVEFTADSLDTGLVSGTATISGYDPALAAAQNREIFDGVSQKNAAGRQALQQSIRTTTVDPQQVFGGTLTFELPEKARKAKQDVPMTFVVTINGERHRFDTLLRRH